MDEGQLKAAVAAELNIAVERLSARIWDELIRRRYVAEALDETDDERAVGDVADEYRNLSAFLRGAREDSSPQRAVEEVSFEDTDMRLSTLASIIAMEAGRFRAVQDFRHAYLGTELLDPAKVAAWIRKKAPAEGAPAAGAALEFPGEGGVCSVRVPSGGVLDALTRVSRLLQTTYDWSQPQAVLFVLTGECVPIAKARVTLRRVRPFTALSRITIDVDPRTSPRRLERIYSTARLELREGGDRDISEKHACLALFAAEQGLRAASSPEIATLSVRPLDTLTGGKARMRMVVDLSSETPPPAISAPRWAALLPIWNRDHPDWAYTNVNCVKDFGRDVRAAWTRVTGQPWALRKDPEDLTDEAP
jgi:hypothetical protein